MTTTVTKTIGSSGCDYTTLAAWIAACSSNLVTADIIYKGVVKNETFSGSGRICHINGLTTDSTRYVELTTDTGCSFRDDSGVATNPLKVDSTKGAMIENSGNSGYSIQITVPYTRISNLQFSCTTNGGACLQISGSNTNGDVNNCIFETKSQAPGVELAGAGNKIRNSVIIGRYTTLTMTNVIQMASGASAYNCTFVVPSDITKATNCFAGNYGSPVVKNCAIFGCTGVSTGATRTYTNCITDVSSPPSGCTTATFNTTQFVGITDSARDYRPPSGSALIDAGATESTYAGTDIRGTSRPAGSSYDVGAWEYTSSGPTLVQYYLGSDFLSGGWTPSTGATLFGTVDEPTTPSDSDYAQSSLNPSSDLMELFFQGVQTPSTNTDHTLKYRIKGDNSCNMAVALYCGTVLIRTDSYTPAPSSYTTYTINLTTGEASAIAACADPTALKLRVTAG